MTPAIFAGLEAGRRRTGFLTVEETAALTSRHVFVMDPFSTLIGRDVVFAGGCRIEPSVLLDARDGGRVEIGTDTVLGMGTKLQANAGRLFIGAGAEIGLDRGFVVRADGPGVEITVGARARLLGGGALFGNATIGDGAQLLGPIDAFGVRLAAGEDYRAADPDLRGGVLKGAGVARGLFVGRGEVVQAFGDFAAAPVRRQAEFHRRPS